MAGVHDRFGAGRGVAMYLGLCLLPLAVAVVGPTPAGRGFWVEFGVGLGFVALGLLAVQFMLTGRIPAFAGSLGQDTVLRFHRVAGIGAAVCVFAHPAVLIAADPAYAAFFDPRVNAMRAVSLTGVLAMILALVLLSVFRARLAFKYEWWRVSHAALSVLVMLVAAAHVVMVDHYSGLLMKKAAFVAVIVAPLGLLAHARLVRPLLVRRKPWRVDSVTRERERVWTVTLTPVGHGGLRFEAGQFAWLVFGDNPWSQREHPFTIASSAERPGELRFSVKELGDFTGTIGSLERGGRAFVLGPAGGFTVPGGVPEVVFIAGGIGVTPAMSLIRTAADRGTGPDLHLIYCTKTLETATFRAELERAEADGFVRVDCVPEKPPESWGGESGFLDADKLARLVGRVTLEKAYFMVCGPAPMMDAVEDALLALGVDRVRIRSERFDII